MADPTLADFDTHRREAATRSGPVSYVDTGGDGPAALFVHGLGTSSYLWRRVIGRLRERYRCVAIDLPLHGRTPAAPDQDFSLAGVAGFVAGCCDALGLDRVDLVANDTGGAVAQLFAARHGDRLRTLTLTNCDTEDNLPPPSFLPTVELARAGKLAANGTRLLANIGHAGRLVYGSGYARPELLSDDLVRAWLEPIFGTEANGRAFERWLCGLDGAELAAARPELSRLRVPTLIVWGNADDTFETKWAYWLRDTIPGVTEVVELDGVKLFFPDERPDELAAALAAHWNSWNSARP